MREPAFVPIGDIGDFPLNQVKGLRVQDRAICVVNAGGALYALDDRCSHAEASLSAGDIEGTEVVCPLHGARFSAETGDALTMPAVKPVRTYPIRTEGTRVLIGL